LLVGQQFQSIKTGRKALRIRWTKKWEPLLIGRTVRAIDRRGKWIRSTLDDGSLLIFHLGMTGQLTLRAVDAPLETHTHLVFALAGDKEQLRFRDVRRFGSAFRLENNAAWESFLEDTLGPEPFDLDPAAWRAALKKTDRALKAILLDQRVVAGVGNIYADESLFLARLDPRRRGNQLTSRQADRLRQAIADVLTAAIESRGSTIRDYVGGSGLQGSHQKSLHVYGRAGEPCLKCETPITSIRLAGRSTHFCVKCQK
jgi:formamidopyrimidine-DNA glycosylase